MDGGGGRRITVSPRPCNGKRVVAKKRGRSFGGGDGFVNSVKKLQRREICSKRDRSFTMTDAQERFRNIRLQVPFWLWFPRNLSFFFLLFLWEFKVLIIDFPVCCLRVSTERVYCFFCICLNRVDDEICFILSLPIIVRMEVKSG
jgi:hypothetical protein